MKQEMMGWQWHQLGRMQIICVSLQIDNHNSASLLNFFTGLTLFLTPTNSVKAQSDIWLIIVHHSVDDTGACVPVRKVKITTAFHFSTFIFSSSALIT